MTTDDLFDVRLMERMTPEDLEEFTKTLEEFAATEAQEEPNMSVEEFGRKFPGYAANNYRYSQLLGKYMQPGD